MLLYSLPLPVGLAQPTSEEDIRALKDGTFYSFASNPYKLKSLDLDWCDDFCLNNWDEHPERLQGLLAAMAKTQIKHSLEEIVTFSRKVSKSQMEEMMVRHGFTNSVEVYYMQ
jgi:hypothetical protein